MLIDSSGRVGIGTTSPSVLVHGAVSSGAANLRLESTANSGEAGLQLYGKNSGGTVRTATIKYDASDYFRIATASAVAIAFETNDTERARIDSSGRLLVGTSTNLGTAEGYEPRFQVAGSTQGASIGRYQASNPYGAQLYLQRSKSDTVGAHTVMASGDEVGYISFEGSDGTAFKRAAAISAVVDGTPGANDMPGRLVFSTTADGASSPTEAMRINNAGVTSFGANQRLEIRETSAVTAGTTGRLIAFNSSSGACYITTDYISSNGTAVIAGDSGTLNGIWFRTYDSGYDYRFRIARTGSATNSTGTYGTISDERVKTVIGDASSQWQDIKQLNLVKYKLNKDVDYEQSKENVNGYKAPVLLGLVAQEVEQVCPGLVETAADPDLESIKTVKTSILYMKAVKALQEAMERIEQLEARLTAAGIE